MKVSLMHPPVLVISYIRGENLIEQWTTARLCGLCWSARIHAPSLGARQHDAGEVESVVEA